MKQIFSRDALLATASLLGVFAFMLFARWAGVQ